ncbi:MAG: ATP-binding cassette, subfamily bacterial [Xanthobacteraceae bacterium]|jgi:ABC-type multidrug transport system fused ATPase/permease subunit|nr:ATP-binding cassette, subfamily bacterial [Xanthobacteraceae bacterium]
MKTEAPSSRGSRRSRHALLADLRRVISLATERRWPAPVLIMLGLAVSFTETIGITLVVLFIYSAMGRAGDAIAVGGVVGRLYEMLLAHIGSAGLLSLIILALIAAKGLLSYLYRVIGASVQARVNETVHNNLHRQYLYTSYDFIRSHEQAHLLDILAKESWAVADAYVRLTRIFINLCSIIIFVAFLLILSWRVTLIALVGSVLLSAGLRFLYAPVRRLGKETHDVNQRLADRILVTLQGMRTIRAFGQEARQHTAFRGVAAEARRNAFRLELLYGLVNPATEIGYLALLCLIVGLAQPMGASFATTLAAVALLYRLQPHVREFESNLLYIAQLELPIRSVLNMLETADKRYVSPGQYPFEQFRESIVFDDVSFTYMGGSLPALDRARFTIRTGSTTAIVGASGAGKTTIVNLLLRLYEPDAGSILVDGDVLQDLLRTDWLSRVAIAGQDVDLIDGTIADNIRMARPEASEAEVTSAAEAAGVMEIVARSSSGFETWIGQQGLNLSGGQRQRIGLARAILRDPDLLILDEATSALDHEIEQSIRANLATRFAGRTILIITHRLETLRAADHVICLHEGRVIEEGSPTELLSKRESTFQRLLARQQRSDRPPVVFGVA